MEQAINRNVKYGDIVWVRGVDTAVRQVTVLGGVKKSPELFIHFGRIILRGEDISGITDYEVTNRIHITHPPAPMLPDTGMLQQKIRELEAQIVRGRERELALDQALARVKALVREASPRTQALQELDDTVQQAQKEAGTFGLHLRSPSISLQKCHRPACPGTLERHTADECPAAPGNLVGDLYRGR